MRISDWSSDVCSSDLTIAGLEPARDRWIGKMEGHGHSRPVESGHRLMTERDLIAFNFLYPAHRLIGCRFRSDLCRSRAGNRPRLDARQTCLGRSEERREGQEGVSKFSFRW